MISNYTLKLISNYSNLGPEAVEQIGLLGLRNVITLKSMERLGLPKSGLGKPYKIYIPKYNYIYRYHCDGEEGRVLTYEDISLEELKYGIELGIIDREAIKIGTNSVKIYNYPGLDKYVDGSRDLERLVSLLGASDISGALEVLKNEYGFSCTNDYLRLLGLNDTYKVQSNGEEEIGELCSLVDLIDRLIERENLIDIREELIDLKIGTMINDINAMSIYNKIRRAGGMKRCLGKK